MPMGHSQGVPDSCWSGVGPPCRRAFLECSVASWLLMVPFLVLALEGAALAQLAC